MVAIEVAKLSLWNNESISVTNGDVPLQDNADSLPQDNADVPHMVDPSLPLVTLPSAISGGPFSSKPASRDSAKPVKNSACCTCSKVCSFVVDNFLPIALVFVVVFGVLVPWPGAAINHKATNYVCTIGIFIYSGLYLKTDEIKSAVRAYKAAIWGLVSIIFVTSIVGCKLTSLLDLNPTFNRNVSNQSSSSRHSFIGPKEFVTGIQVYMCMPCSIASGVVMVTQLGGNYALALLLTVVANVIGVFSIPLLVKWMVASDSNVHFDLPNMLLQLFLTLLVPLVAGKLFRFVRPVKPFIMKPRVKVALKLLSVVLLVTITWMQVSRSSLNGDLKRLTMVNVFVVIGWSIAMHLIFWLINGTGSWLLRLDLTEKKCIIVLASQKTLAVAIPVAAFLPAEMGDPGLMAIAMVVTHLPVIVVDSVLISFYSTWVASTKAKLPSEALSTDSLE